MIEAYRHGLFPMADPWTGQIGWYDPDPRAIIPLEEGRFHVSRSLRQRVRSGRFEITHDSAFDEVICACARPEKRDGCWINDQIIAVYGILHRHGRAHSVEAWRTWEGRRRLVGGLYGVAIGGFFAGESMFCRPEDGGTDASKVCLVHLVEHLRRRGFVLLDTQFRNPHMNQFGCVEIPRCEYKRRLKAAVVMDVAW
ncbi:MAG: leucyl/phenylalanyl-tRNA--protein transferase [Phycisphaerales bacterium]|nr:leucyl/phenylalanyl-tRNA--protein transferase [Phycisphaerales bacterium]